MFWKGHLLQKVVVNIKYMNTCKAYLEQCLLLGSANVFINDCLEGKAGSLQMGTSQVSVSGSRTHRDRGRDVAEAGLGCGPETPGEHVLR